MSDIYNYSIRGQVSDGTLTTSEMSQQYERGYISVIFYSDSSFQTPVMPTGGTILFEASETDINYGTIENGSVSASSTSYNRPNFAGAVGFVRATCSSIVGANFYIATISKFS